MISNEQQRRIAERRVRQLRESSEGVAGTESRSYNYLIESVQTEIDEYDSIKSGQTKSFRVQSLDEIGEAIIKARIARGWNQRQLAQEMEVTEQAVQKDEATRYEHAGLARMADILDALNYDLRGSVEANPEPEVCGTVYVGVMPTMQGRFSTIHGGGSTASYAWTRPSLYSSGVGAVHQTVTFDAQRAGTQNLSARFITT